MKKRNDASHVMIWVGKPQGMQDWLQDGPQCLFFPASSDRVGGPLFQDVLLRSMSVFQAKHFSQGWMSLPISTGTWNLSPLESALGGLCSTVGRLHGWPAG